MRVRKTPDPRPHNLGNVWLELVTEDREGQPTNAIACYEAALRVYP